MMKMKMSRFVFAVAGKVAGTTALLFTRRRSWSNLRCCLASHLSGPYHHDQGADSPIFDAEYCIVGLKFIYSNIKVFIFQII